MQLFRVGNSKLKKDNIAYFNLPAVKTCPYNGRHIEGSSCSICFACKKRFTFDSVKNVAEVNYEISKANNFTDIANRSLKSVKQKIIRFNGSGDIYDHVYFEKLCKIAESNRNKQFYCYTKSVPIVKANEYMKPSNFKIIYSFGGLCDKLIDKERDNYAMVFNTRQEIRDAGLSDASDSDMVALKHRTVGLIRR